MNHPLTRRSSGDVDHTVAAVSADAVRAWQDLAAALSAPELTAQVDAAGAALVGALAGGGALLVAGNGGSAAIASHIAAEFIGKCVQDRPPLPSINLAESLSSVTAVANDYGYDQVFSRGVQAHGRPGDVFLAMTTSGTSPNVLAALDAATQRGLITIVLTGAKGEGLHGRADHVLIVPSDQTPRIQEVHLLWAHAWCEAVDALSQP
ncbi:phosphoheptose isomerase [Branchiibius hedensis]|uniref:Phosphoheptose isomerase n=1 Tax=Branchiibius hedensis TaxID=672460 RepID=A0A2Y8ZNY6_9MICO|nr:SIS domain-containing protein [Branchiibius hedensis]PWJ25267.1 phosphoheptose isomerase [Branchiibius hedensis]SSA34081.1 phosphoheptose isomerase [Branchiibius hedensis]